MTMSARCDDIEPHDPHGDCDGLALVAGDALLDHIVNGESSSVALTEFLLARIAEDEEVAQSVPPYPHDVAVSDVATVRAHLTRWTALRVLADCEAKRQIVQRERANGIGRPDAFPWNTATLAAIYADHPDYREDWKP